MGLGSGGGIGAGTGDPGGRALAVDLGARRIGLAVSDPLGLTAQGLPSLQRGVDPVEQVLAACREWEAATVVVGLPLNMNGTRGPAAQAAEEFAAELRRRIAVGSAPDASGTFAHATGTLTAGAPTVALQDERLSSVSAERVLIEAGVGRSKRRKGGLVDRGAATVFLQAYLDRQPRG